MKENLHIRVKVRRIFEQKRQANNKLLENTFSFLSLFVLFVCVLVEMKANGVFISNNLLNVY